MSEVVLFHHVQGLTDGVRSFAEQLRGRVTLCTRRTCSTGRRSRRSRRAWRSRARSASARWASAASPPPMLPPRRRLRRHLVRGDGRAAARADASRRRWSAVHLRVPPLHRVRRRVAGRRPRSGARQGRATSSSTRISKLRARSSTRPTTPSCSSTPATEHLFIDASLPAYDADATALLVERVLLVPRRS